DALPIFCICISSSYFFGIIRFCFLFTDFYFSFFNFYITFFYFQIIGSFCFRSCSFSFFFNTRIFQFFVSPCICDIHFPLIAFFFDIFLYFCFFNFCLLSIICFFNFCFFLHTRCFWSA